MQINNHELHRFLNELLKPEKIRDYCPNGLQVEGKADVRRIVTGVTASQALIDAAVEKRADAIIVHHGYFWKGENPCLTGMKRTRLATLLKHDINLFAYHLPLDIHPKLGNNAQLAQRLGIEVDGGLIAEDPNSVAMRGHLQESISVAEMAARLTSSLKRTPLVEGDQNRKLRTIAWCTGGGQGFIEQAAEQGIDAFITGEVSEQTIHTAREMGIAFFAAGHHATERYGAMAIGQYLAEQLDLSVEFVDIDNPA
ncbi:Nif3-like dinuclear metal center hexameric protein [Aestuariibacter salexigens]|uniref:Nif3-like dinuclear metal center hexameric protein n=1 Tax=Aestuariibacter salexigens TaxID=226010 RepID=UPI0003F6BE29|nr:Nif3-like dinuclear metal center hexameric protein [Aestuariibacter salexigens]